MKITFIGHAAILIETGGITVLSDPWWRGPCFGAQWWIYPPPSLASIEGKKLDYIYISHGHHDHLHPGTLRTLDRRAKVLVSRNMEMAPAIRELDFEVLELSHGQEFALGNSGASCFIMDTDGGDSLMAIWDDEEVCLNLNDALHSSPEPVQTRFIELLRKRFPEIDYVFCGYGTASHFPNCYVVPDKDREASAVYRQRHFNESWARIVNELGPNFGFPFAADVVLLEEDLIWANESVHNGERPTFAFKQRFPDSKVQVRDIAPGFTVCDGDVDVDLQRMPLRESELRKTHAKEIERANRYGSVSEGEVLEVLELLQRNLEKCREFLSECPEDYRFRIDFRGSEMGILFTKQGSNLELSQCHGRSRKDLDLTFTTRLHYLKWTLTRPYGDEILFVGSGAILEYSQRARASSNVHRELIQLIRGKPVRQSRVLGRGAGLKKMVKDRIKRLLGLEIVDLYDLERWTIFR